MLRDKNPDHWKLLFFYYNPQGPLWVLKRYGSLYTPNFAKPVTWAMAGLLVAIPVIGSIVATVHPGH